MASQCAATARRFWLSAKEEKKRRGEKRNEENFWAQSIRINRPNRLNGPTNLLAILDLALSQEEEDDDNNNNKDGGSCGPDPANHGHSIAARAKK